MNCAPPTRPYAPAATSSSRSPTRTAATPGSSAAGGCPGSSRSICTSSRSAVCAAGSPNSASRSSPSSTPNHDPVDLLAAVWLALDHAAPRETPLAARAPGPLRRALRGALLLAGVPALLTATLLDRLAIRPLAQRLHLANAYRLVARRE
ncbi:exported hypothetical protein [Streptomyces murinus]